ncbi:unnamed protein product [Durusdinium trenchii]|uniref:FAD-binding PCMH-type domain-containing protein n=1 Tax=Durusdinium trenchii TaxID=1381693 RepID=A0ABP0HNH3_9DINO
MSLTWALAFAFALGPLSADRQTDSSCQLQLRETRMDSEIESDTTETETTERTGKRKGQQPRGQQQRSRWFRDCVDAFAEEGYQLTVPAPGPMSLVNHSNYDLYLQASRLCQDFLFCAYQGCTPPKRGACAALQEDKIRQFAGYPGKLTAQLRRCPPDNLPFSVVTAETVSDIIDGIKSAKQLGTTVSVKTSGHNYAGSSTFHGSVSINMANYEKYSKSNILECGTLPEPVPTSMSNQKAVCKLAAARGKLAVVRVGGGENWNEVYSAVYWYQFPSQTTRRYHVVGGAAGTVSAAGGWLQVLVYQAPQACESGDTGWISSCRLRWCCRTANM